MNNVITLPILLLIIHLLALIHGGWSSRIRNRMISRYVATYELRERHLPTKENLVSRFALTPTERTSLTVQGPDQTTLTYKSHHISHSFYLWRPRETYFDFPF